MKHEHYSFEMILCFLSIQGTLSIEQPIWKNVNNCWNTKITFCLETFCGQSSNPNLNVVNFSNTIVN